MVADPMTRAATLIAALGACACSDWAGLSKDFEGAGVCPTYVVAGDTHTCVRKTSGSLWCWGDNRFGQLGTGDTQQHLLPARVGFAGREGAKVYLPAGD